MAKSREQYDYSDKLSFLAEWFDYEASQYKKFILNYFPYDQTVELFDRQLNRMYLRRCCVEDVSPKDIFVGNTIFVYGRRIKITDYADCRSQNYVGKTKEHALVIIKPSLFDKLGEILSYIDDKEFQITKMRSCSMTKSEVQELYESIRNDPTLTFTIDHMTSGPVLVMELVGDDAIERWNEYLGPDDPLEARRTAPESLRAMYGEDRSKNGFYTAKSENETKKAISLFFGNEHVSKTNELQLQNTTCCIVKPHAIKQGHLGNIITYIQQHQFKITCLQMFFLTRSNVNEFLEVYKGVISDYNALQTSFLSGPCVVMEIANRNSEIDVHGEFRRLVGPWNPKIAQEIRPYTIRAKFGCEGYNNGVHCTDLPEDTVLELEYFFRILKF